MALKAIFGLEIVDMPLGLPDGAGAPPRAPKSMIASKALVGVLATERAHLHFKM